VSPPLGMDNHLSTKSLDRMSRQAEPGWKEYSEGRDPPLAACLTWGKPQKKHPPITQKSACAALVEEGVPFKPSGLMIVQRKGPTRPKFRDENPRRLDTGVQRSFPDSLVHRGERRELIRKAEQDPYLHKRRGSTIARPGRTGPKSLTKRGKCKGRGQEVAQARVSEECSRSRLKKLRRRPDYRR